MSSLALNAALKGGALGLACGLLVLTGALLAGDAGSLPMPLLLLPLASFAGGVGLGLFLNKRKTH